MICATAGAASAQTSAGQAPQALALPQDPPGVNRATADIDVQAFYDSNIAQSSAAVAEQRGLVLADESVRPQATLDLLKAVGSQSLFLNGIVGYDFYVNNKILNNHRIDLAGGAELRARQCRGVVSGEYASSQTQLAEITTLSVVNTNTQTSVNFNVDCTRPIGIAPTLLVSNTWSANSNIQLVSTNYRSLLVQPGIAYQLPTLGRVTIFGQYVDTTFPDRLFVTQGDAYQLYAGGIRFDHRIGARIEGSFELTYTDLQPNAPGVPKFSGPTYLLDVEAHATSRVTGQVHLERSIIPSVVLGSTFTIDDNYRGELDYAMNSRIRFSGGVGYIEQRFNGPASNSNLFLEHQTLLDYYGDAQLNLGRRFTLTVDVREENRRANLQQLNYSSTRVSLTLATHI
jgi:hypothetical protein